MEGRVISPSAGILVVGTETLLGSALVRRLAAAGYENVLSLEGDVLRDAGAVLEFFRRERPRFVLVPAGKSGGIQANTRHPATLMADNLLCLTHVLEAARQVPPERLLLLVSCCVYPKLCSQPMRTESLWTGPLEPTNEAYAAAKLAAMTFCQSLRKEFGLDFNTAITANLFGAGDHFDPENAHVIPSLLVRFHEARRKNAPQVVVWGSGKAVREFVYADDAADGALFLLERYSCVDPINLGGGTNKNIGELAVEIARVVGYEGEVVFDTTKPDGMPLKGLDCGALELLGWHPSTPFEAAIEETYRHYLSIEDTRHANY